MPKLTARGGQEGPQQQVRDAGLPLGVSIFLAMGAASEKRGPGLKPTETLDSSVQPSLTSSPGPFQVAVPIIASHLHQSDQASAFETAGAMNGKTQGAERAKGAPPAGK